MIPFIRRELPSLAVLALAWGLAAYAWPLAPDRLPVHFDLHGLPDRYGSRAEGLLLLPAIATGVWLLMLAVPRVDPNRNLASFEPSYRWMRVGILAFLVAVHAVTTAVGLGADVDVGRALGVGLGLLLAFLGNLLGKLRPNGFAGIRTPWTLTSVRSWNVTHRMGGWMLVAVGLLGAAVSAVSAATGLGVLVGGSVAMTVLTAAWSWKVWRDDPDKAPFGGVHPAER